MIKISNKEYYELKEIKKKYLHLIKCLEDGFNLSEQVYLEESVCEECDCRDCSECPFLDNRK